MAAFVANQSTQVRAGQQRAVLSAENLANGGFTAAVKLDSAMGGPVPLTVINLSGQAMTLYVGAKNSATSDLAPWADAAGDACTPANGTAITVMVTGGLYYSLKAGAQITAGTAYMCR